MAANKWTDELKEQVIAQYEEGEPTADNTISLLEDLVKETGFTLNGIRMILIKAGVYVKVKEAKAGTEKGDKPKRKSKQDSIDELTKSLEDNDIEVDESVVSKLTGKAAEFFTGVVTTLTQE